MIQSSVCWVRGSGDYNLKIKKYSRFCCAGNFYYDRKKKDTVVCLAGARSLLRPENKKVPVVCLAGRQSLLRPEKKQVLVICLAGARSLLRPEKKSFSRLTGGCAIVITNGK